MTVVGRLVVRVVSAVSYMFLAGATIAFVTSDLRSLQWIGALFVLFLADRILHVREGDRPLYELPTDGKVNVAPYLAPQAFAVLASAWRRNAFTRGNALLAITEELLRRSDVRAGLARLDVSFEEFGEKVREVYKESAGSHRDHEGAYASTEALVVRATALALENDHAFVEPHDLFSALPLVGDDSLVRIFHLFSINPGDLERALIFTTARRGILARIPIAVAGAVLETYRPNTHRIMNRAWTARPTPALDKVSTDFTDLARTRKIGFLIGHASEYERMLSVLSLPTRPNVLLVGEEGSGKETIVLRLARDIVDDTAPESLRDKRVVGLNLSSLVAGAPPEELQARLRRIIDEIEIAGNILLYIPDIHNLVRTSGSAFMSAADALIPIIMNDTFPVIGATYPREFKQHVESRSDFVGAFDVIRVGEITNEEAEKLLVYEALALEERNGIVVSFGAVKRAVGLAKKYLHEKRLPGSARELLKEAMMSAEKRGEKTLTPERVDAVAETKVNIPIHEAGAGEAEKLLNLEDIIHERFIDQHEAVKAVASALREYRSGLARPGGPIATFLFVGPTGVGKTELAKLIADIQFGSEKLMVRFDMSEFQERSSIARFIGSSDGSISGALTDTVRQKPYSLILLDEFEKSHPDILNLFLQVFDDGRLTDGSGTTVDFQNTIIIATSNAHSDIMNEALSHGESVASVSDYLKKKLTDVFRPELLNRFSKIVVFKDLALDDVKKVASLQLAALGRTLEQQGIALSYDDSVVSLVARLGYDPAFGARPLRRVIEEKIRSPLAEAILRKQATKGGSISLVAEGEELKIVTR